MKKITGKQDEVLSFIEDYWQTHSISPSFREIQEHFGFKSPNAVTKHLQALEKKGFVAQQKNTHFTKARSILSLRAQDNDVPLVGRIVAGEPVESIENVDDHLNLSFLGIRNSRKDYFALKVKGDSMINAHILDGDIVVIKKQPDVARGEVAAVLWNGEATLKYVHKKGTKISLVPANDSMEPKVIDRQSSDSFSILGKLVTVIRHY